MSHLSRGHVPSVPSSVPSVPGTFCPLNVNFHKNRPKRPGCPWDVPNLSPGRSRGIPTTKFLYVIFLYRFFVLHNQKHCVRSVPPENSLNLKVQTLVKHSKKTLATKCIHAPLCMFCSIHFPPKYTDSYTTYFNCIRIYHSLV